MQIKLDGELYELIIPQDFEDYHWDSKGYFSDAVLRHAGNTYVLNFYEPVRFNQDVAMELRQGTVFFVKNLLLVPDITRSALLSAVERFLRDHGVKSLAG